VQVQDRDPLLTRLYLTQVIQPREVLNTSLHLHQQQVDALDRPIPLR
jgi:hypothetical protein